jgi:quercetin dioxygenase-like cupin family protein
MQVYDWAQVPREDLNPLFSRQCIHADTMTIARVYLKKGCLVPEHSHHNEQLSMMSEGRLKFVIDGKELVLNPGEALRIPPHVPHSALALDDCVATDIFSPPREDWKSGDDAYLRGGLR